MEARARMYAWAPHSLSFHLRPLQRFEFALRLDFRRYRYTEQALWHPNSRDSFILPSATTGFKL